MLDWVINLLWFVGAVSLLLRLTKGRWLHEFFLKPTTDDATPEPGDPIVEFTSPIDCEPRKFSPLVLLPPPPGRESDK